MNESSISDQFSEINLLLISLNKFSIDVLFLSKFILKEGCGIEYNLNW